MATITMKKTVDDMDGSADANTISFALDGAAYEIDLSDVNAQRLRDALAPYIEHGKKVTARRAAAKRGARASSASGYSREEMAAIRAWAKADGRKVSDRGRLPREVIEAFQAAH